jgi:hypothetical protein
MSNDNADARLAELEATVATLSARVRELEDDREIRDLLARYGYMADNCDDEGFVNLYTDDGAIALSISKEAAAAMGTDAAVWRGKDAVREFITHPQGHHSPQLYGKSMHLHGNNLVTHIHGDEAVADSYGIAVATADGENTIVSAGNNQWRLQRVDGRWLIRERRGATLGDDQFATNLDATPE